MSMYMVSGHAAINMTKVPCVSADMHQHGSMLDISACATLPANR
jgi:hypothetical protein